LAPETFLARVVALGELLVDRAAVDTVFSHALERVAPLRRLVRSELAVRHDPPPDLAVAALAGELERERPCRARPREEARHVAPPRFALECVQQRGADATTPVIRMHAHPDVLCAVRPRHEADRDPTVTDDRLAGLDDGETHAARVLEHVLPLPPLVRGLAFHRMALRISGLDEGLAIGVRERTRAIAGRQSRVQVVEHRRDDRRHMTTG